MTGQASAGRNPERTPQNPNIFSDDYAESFAESYAETDGAQSLRRSESPVSPVSPTSQQDHEPYDTFCQPLIPSQPTHPNRGASMRQNLSKSTRNGGQQEDRAQENPSGPGLRAINTTIQPVSAHRSTSSASGHSFAGSQSPVSPGDGPSHPYGMYPQGLGMSRTASIATASTRPSSLNPTSRAPAHPYSMYTQNVAGDTADGNQTHAIPVGFPGSNQQFRRQIGPEGEEQDIIGPDGHTEQLPPYSRFAEESNHKTIAGGTLSAIGESDGPGGHPTSPGVSERNSGVRDSRMTGASDTAELNPGGSMPRENFEQERSEKRWNEKSWREKRKTKVLGVPLWFVLLLVATLVVIAVICGGVIGGVLGEHRKAHEEHTHEQHPTYEPVTGSTPTATVTETQLIDASPVTSTPQGLPGLPTGTFKSTVEDPTFVSTDCLTNPDQKAAWNCTLTPGSLDIIINTSGPRPQMQLNADPNSQMSYGVQPPNTSMTGLSFVWDTQHMELGPAYQFQTLYQKLVILPIDAIKHSDSKLKRYPQLLSYEYGEDHFHDDEFDMNPYDIRDVDSDSRAWFCYWPGTFLEVFIYANESIPSSGTGSSTSSSSSSSSSSSTSSSTSSISGSAVTPPAVLPPSVPIDPTPHYGPPLPTGSPQSYSSQSLYQERAWRSPWDSPSKRGNDDLSGSSCPRKVKIEERRLELPGYDPYCQKMQYEDSSWKPVTDDDDGGGGETYIPIPESDPSIQGPIGKERRAIIGGARKRKRGSSGSSCYCEWNNWS